MMEAVDLVYSEMREKSTTVSVPSALARMAVLPHTLLHKKVFLLHVKCFYIRLVLQIPNSVR